MATIVSKDIGKIKALWKRFTDPEYRAAYLHSRLRTGIAGQVYFMRESRRWTQGDLAARAGTKQPAISRIEKGEASLSISTLEQIAKAFDVGLSVRFVPHSEVLEDSVLGRPEAYIPSFDDDTPASLHAHAPLPTAQIRSFSGFPISRSNPRASDAGNVVQKVVINA